MDLNALELVSGVRIAHRLQLALDIFGDVAHELLPDLAVLEPAGDLG